MPHGSFWVVVYYLYYTKSNTMKNLEILLRAQMDMTKLNLTQILTFLHIIAAQNKLNLSRVQHFNRAVRILRISVCQN